MHCLRCFLLRTTVLLFEVSKCSNYPKYPLFDPDQIPINGKKFLESASLSYILQSVFLYWTQQPTLIQEQCNVKNVLLAECDRNLDST